MNLRAASKGEAGASTVRDYLLQAADATGTHGDDLLAELGRWAVLDQDREHATSSQEERYLEAYGGTLEELRARLEGFRQVTGVLPERFLELQREQQKDVFEVLIVAVPDQPSPQSPIGDGRARTGSAGEPK